MSVSNLEKIIKLSPEVKSLVTKSAERLALSGRAFHRVLKVSQTIADLEGAQGNKKGARTRSAPIPTKVLKN
jgi:magnesium chelatase family protein